MRFIFILLISIAALLTVLIVGLIILSIGAGGGSVVIPGLGLVISLPFIILVLAAIDVVIIFLAIIFKRLSGKINSED